MQQIQNRGKFKPHFITLEAFNTDQYLTSINGNIALYAPNNVKRSIANALKKQAHFLERVAETSELFSWELELETLQAEQDQDINNVPHVAYEAFQSEASYLDSLAETYGKTVVFYG